MNKIFALSIMLILFFSSCEKLLIRDDVSDTTPQEIYEYLWKECDTKYSYFDVKNIDWDSIKNVYNTRIRNDMHSTELFDMLAQMLNELEDGHVNLIAPHNLSFYRVEKKGPDNFDWRILKDHYLPDNYGVTGSLRHAKLKNENIAYVRYPQFYSENDSTYLKYVLGLYKETDGMIFDIRENGGGLIASVYSLLSHIAKKKTLLYYSRIKDGPKHDDFTPATEVHISPSETEWNKKIVVLTDRGSYSAASLFALACKALDNVVVIGDTTGGGLGMPNGGQLPNGWNYRFSVTQTLDLSRNPHYENGVPPDIFAFMNWNDRTKDEVIERAILELKK